MAPVALNVAYMTSSNIVNAWIGIGVSYNFAALPYHTFLHSHNYMAY